MVIHFSSSCWTTSEAAQYFSLFYCPNLFCIGFLPWSTASSLFSFEVPNFGILSQDFEIFSKRAGTFLTTCDIERNSPKNFTQLKLFVYGFRSFLISIWTPKLPNFSLFNDSVCYNIYVLTFLLNCIIFMVEIEFCLEISGWKFLL